MLSHLKSTQRTGLEPRPTWAKILTDTNFGPKKLWSTIFLDRFGRFWTGLNRFGTFADILGCFGLFWDVFGRFGTFLAVLGCLGHYGSILVHFGPFWSILGSFRPFWAKTSFFTPKIKFFPPQKRVFLPNKKSFNPLTFNTKLLAVLLWDINSFCYFFFSSLLVFIGNGCLRCKVFTPFSMRSFPLKSSQYYSFLWLIANSLMSMFCSWSIFYSFVLAIADKWSHLASLQRDILLWVTLPGEGCFEEV